MCSPRAPAKVWNHEAAAASRPDFASRLDSRRTLFRPPAARPPALRPAIADQMQDFRAQLGRNRLPRFQRPEAAAVSGSEVGPAAGQPVGPPADTTGLRPVSEIPTTFQSVFKEFTYFNKGCTYCSDAPDPV